MAFREFYLESLDKHQFKPSAQQEAVLLDFEAIAQSLKHSWLKRFFKANESGIYLWGAVGRGKSFLTELFLHYIQVPSLRFHLHTLMKELESLPAEKNKIDLWVDKISDETKVILIDEFVVNDIATAMQLKRILLGLTKKNILILITSNFSPNELYQGGLQRQRFLPTIAFINQHFRVKELKGEKDYRYEALKNYAHQTHHKESFEQLFKELAPTDILYQSPVTLDNRTLPSLAVSDSLIWFDFEILFGDGRSTRDYLDLAENFQILLISNLPKTLDDNKSDVARRLIHAIDAFYEAQLKVVWEDLIDDLYVGEKLAAEWARANSRLKLMQSKNYWENPHNSPL